jgi:protein gp37
MSDGTSIEWTDASWNPIRARYDGAVVVGDAEPIEFSRKGWHCEHVSEGCRHCYAESFNRRLGTGWDYKPGHRKNVEIYLDEQMLDLPLKWRRARKIFVCSMTDLFADFVKDEWIDRMFAIMALAPRHQFQLLTKRPERMREYLANPELQYRVRKLQPPLAMPRGLEWGASPVLPNVWLGVSVEDQATANERIPHLLATPAAIRWLSMEPLLGPVWPWHELILAKANGIIGQAVNGEMPGIDWVVAGGESGAGARPMHPDWARSIRNQCKAAGVPFLFKQWGAWLPGENDGSELLARWQDGETGRHSLTLNERRSPEWRHYEPGGPGSAGAFGIRIGKKRAGRELDGIEHNGYPA